MPCRIILFGGTFDPVHYAHSHLADFVAGVLKADKVIFIPALRSPHKHSYPVADAQRRLEMLSLAVRDDRRLGVSDCELKRPEPSYTIDTVSFFRAEYGAGAQLYWLAGADVVKDLGRWHRLGDLLALCRLCVMYRAGCEKPDFAHLENIIGTERVLQLAGDVIATELIDISSRRIRAMVAGGRDITGLVCPAVEDYIKRNGLYAKPSGNQDV